MRNKNKAGFTLIELLVVIAIIGLLASVVLLALNSARAKSRDAKRLADVRQLASAMELFYNDTSAYPTGTVSSANNLLLGSRVLDAYQNGTSQKVGLTPTYIGLIPSAPQPADDTCSASGVGGNNYWYQVANDGSTYTLSFCLGAATGGYIKGTHNLSPAGIQ